MSLASVADGTELHVQIQFHKDSADGPTVVSIGLTEEKTEGYEERLLLKLAHALDLNDATSVTVNT